VRNRVRGSALSMVPDPSPALNALHFGHPLPQGDCCKSGVAVTRLSDINRIRGQAMNRGKGFGDLAAERLRRETDLDRIVAMLNWGPLTYRLEKHCCKLDGRPPFPPIMMFRALLLAQWYELSDRDLEEMLCDRLSFRRFVGLGIEQATPDHTTLCRFRERLNEAGLTSKLLELVNAQLDAKGLMLKRGTLIDATVVETAAAKPPRSADPADLVDPDAAFLKREGKPGTSYGYKAHLAVDEGSLFVRTAKLTPANVAETVVADELIMANRDSGAIYADKAYDTHARRALLDSLGLKDGIMHRPNKHHPLTREQTRRNARLSKIRCRVETVFAVLKQTYGYRRTRYAGIVRNRLQLTLLAICFNLRRMLVLHSNTWSLSSP
jgi:transposase, IS5 family